MKKCIYFIIALLMMILIPFNTFSTVVGDVDGDGKVNTLDYIVVRKHLMKSAILEGDKLSRADVNGDGKVSTADYITIRKIIMKVDATINVTDISLNKTSLSLGINKTEELTVTVNPSNATDKTITWKSSNSSIAEVVNGVVTGLAEGSTIITATSSNGISATCGVTVIKSNGINKVHFIKQSTAADAILLESNGHFAMVDTGYPSKTDNKRVYNYLTSVGAQKLDFVILTHVHKDHTGGFEFLADKMTIDKVYMKEYIGKDHEPAENKSVYKNIKKVITDKNIPVVYVENTYTDGQGFTFEDMDIKLYNTPQRMNQKEFVNGNENINSIMALITANNKKVFLPGDSEDDDIMTKIVNKIGSVNILKIPHHGFHDCSFTMKSAEKINPKHIVVTNGMETHCRVKYFKNNASDYYVNTISKNALVFTVGNTITVDK